MHSGSINTEVTDAICKLKGMFSEVEEDDLSYIKKQIIHTMVTDDINFVIVHTIHLKSDMVHVSRLLRLKGYSVFSFQTDEGIYVFRISW